MRIIEYDTGIEESPVMSKWARELLYQDPEALILSKFMQEVLTGANWTLERDDGLQIFLPKQVYQRRAFKRLGASLTALDTVLGGQFQGATILDLGCGSKRGSVESEHYSFDKGQWEPWLSRVLHHLGAKVEGVDIGSVDNEPFEKHKIDLLREDALAIFTDGQFDLVHSSALYTSPELEKRLGNSLAWRGALASAKILADKLAPQIERVLKPEGVYLFRERRDYLRNKQTATMINPMEVFTPRIIAYI